MAVVQISRVQVRRGRENQGTGVPQLASGEMGWAVDSQKLYIGNGSVSEGAPYVGNTEILTEHSTLLDLVGQYQYKRNDASITTGPSSAQPVQRTLQDRLDDVVSVRSFGVEGDGTTDDTPAIQRAIDQLFLNDATKGSVSSRVTLVFEPGIYIISDTLHIPPYASIRGAGKEKTVIRMTGSAPAVETVGSDSTPGVYGTLSTITNLNKPDFINISDLTFDHTVANKQIFVANVLNNSVFKNVKFKGNWATGTTPADFSIGIELIAVSSILTSRDNLFDSCDFVNVSYGVDSTYDINSNTFTNCLFYRNYDSVILGYALDATPGKEIGPQNNLIRDSRFLEVDHIGYNLIAGTGNSSQSNSYIKVGEDGGTSADALYPVIFFGTSGNFSDNDFFNRSSDLSSDFATYNLTVPYIGELQGFQKASYKYAVAVPMVAGTTAEPLIRLPASSLTGLGYKIHYVYISNAQDATRQGTISLTVNKFTNTILLTDDYDYAGNSANAEDLIFTASLEDLDADSGSLLETIFLRYTNTAATEDGYFNYWFEILS